jgi:hypothetical protein
MPAATTKGVKTATPTATASTAAFFAVSLLDAGADGSSGGGCVDDGCGVGDVGAA